VRAIIGDYIDRVDRVLPSKVEGLYLVGSVALSDYQPGSSDVDFVAVSSQRFPEDALEALAQVHADLKQRFLRPHFDGIYVSWENLRRDPTSAGHVPYTLEGIFDSSGAFEANPAVWLTLRDHAVAVRGMANPGVHHDPALLRRWTVANLNSYWQRLVEQGSTERGRLAMRTDNAIAWCVPGVLRLRYTLATGRITSKSGACLFALETLPAARHAIVRDALALHRGASGSMDPTQRVEEALALMQAVIDGANVPAERA
jgi:hypothetical protein